MTATELDQRALDRAANAFSENQHSDLHLDAAEAIVRAYLAATAGDVDEKAMMEWLVANVGGYSVTMVRVGGERLIGWSDGRGKAIAMRDLRATLTVQSPTLSDLRAENERLREGLRRAGEAFRIYADSAEGHYATKYELASDLRIQADLCEKALGSEGAGAVKLGYEDGYMDAVDDVKKGFLTRENASEGLAGETRPVVDVSTATHKQRARAIYHHDTVEEIMREDVGLTAPPQGWPEDAEFNFGDRVTKHSGSSWTGPVVGWYRTSLTPLGYNIESENEPGSVQLYPAKALRAAPTEEGR